jgi:DNA-binding MarR family transcriptional regulator
MAVARRPREGTLMLLSRLSKQAMRATPESDMGMSIRHFMALHSIPDELPQRQLAETLCIDANNTVILLNELEAAGWVVRERDPADRRRHVVRLTEAGRAAYEGALAARDGIEDDVLGPLDAGERQQLHDLLARALGEG